VLASVEAAWVAVRKEKQLRERGDVAISDLLATKMLRGPS
jgi:hypothetical protein